MGTSVQLSRDDSGVTSLEYALIAALIAVVIVVSVTAVGSSLDKAFADVSAGFAEAAAEDGNTDSDGMTGSDDEDGEDGEDD